MKQGKPALCNGGWGGGGKPGVVDRVKLKALLSHVSGAKF